MVYCQYSIISSTQQLSVSHSFVVPFCKITKGSIIIMRKLIYFFAGLTFIGLVTLWNITPVSAEENTIATSQVAIDLDDYSMPSEKSIYNDNGDYLGKLSIEEVPEIQPRSSYPLQNKTYNVSFIGVSVNFGYKATVKNKKITNAYGVWSNGIIWSTNLGKPTFNSSYSEVKGRTKFGYKDFSFNTTVRLSGYITNNKFWVNLQLS